MYVRELEDNSWHLRFERERESGTDTERHRVTFREKVRATCNHARVTCVHTHTQTHTHEHTHTHTQTDCECVCVCV